MKISNRKSLKYPSYNLHKSGYFHKSSVSGSNYQTSNYELEAEKKKRIMNYKLVQIQGLPKDLATKNVLASKENFGRYGTIVNLTLSPYYDEESENTSEPNQTVTAYITYQTEINSSLALLGAHNIDYKGFKLSAYYGTNRYCHTLLYNVACKKQKCFYLHTFDDLNEAHQAHHLKQKHLQRAFENIKNNLDVVISMQAIDIPFKTNLRNISLILEKLIGKNIITREYYNEAKRIGRNCNSKQVFLKKSLNLVKGISQNQNKQNIQDDQSHASTKRLTTSMVIIPQQFQTLMQTDNSSNQEMKKKLEQDMGEMIKKNILAELNRKRNSSRLDFAKVSFDPKAVLSQSRQRKCQQIRERIKSSLLLF